MEGVGNNKYSTIALLNILEGDEGKRHRASGRGETASARFITAENERGGEESGRQMMYWNGSGQILMR